MPLSFQNALKCHLAVIQTGQTRLEASHCITDLVALTSSLLPCLRTTGSAAVSNKTYDKSPPQSLRKRDVNITQHIAYEGSQGKVCMKSSSLNTVGCPDFR